MPVPEVFSILLGTHPLDDRGRRPFFRSSYGIMWISPSSCSCSYSTPSLIFGKITRQPMRLMRSRSSWPSRRAYCVAAIGRRSRPRNLVPGDVIRLRLGDVVPADVRLLEGDFLSIDQAALTGESMPVSKQSGDPAYSGSVVKQGEMVGVVISTGSNTFFGRTAKLVETAGAVSHFQKAVLKVGNFLIFLALALSLVLILTELARGQDALNLIQFRADPGGGLHSRSHARGAVRDHGAGCAFPCPSTRPLFPSCRPSRKWRALTSFARTRPGP